jgi:hypothetical protein
MALPPLYKFLDVQGAMLTLGRGSLKHAKPSDFNDTEDLTVQSIFPEKLDAALSKIERSFTDVILQNLHESPTCSSPLKEQVALIQQVYRTDPGAADLVKAEIAKGGCVPVFDVVKMQALANTFLSEINDSLQDFRVLCVTTHIDSENMWSRYAENHRGIALRIEPNLVNDSKFQLFRPVVYRDTRPSFYENSLDFVAHSLFGDQAANRLAAIERIVYSKTLEWEHEGEYRLAIPIISGERPWTTLSYHREEITELYLGMAMKQADREAILRRALAINPEIKAFDGRPGFRCVRFDSI